jgi:hypothetical protein
MAAFVTHWWRARRGVHASRPVRRISIPDVDLTDVPRGPRRVPLHDTGL